MSMSKNDKNPTYRKVIHVGKWKSFEREEHKILLNKLQIGSICQRREDGLFEVCMTVKKEPTKEAPAPFKWVRFKKVHTSAEEARAWFSANWPMISKNNPIYQIA